MFFRVILLLVIIPGMVARSPAAESAVVILSLIWPKHPVRLVETESDSKSVILDRRF